MANDAETYKAIIDQSGTMQPINPDKSSTLLNTLELAKLKMSEHGATFKQLVNGEGIAGLALNGVTMAPQGGTATTAPAPQSEGKGRS
mgnify:CR=1 FL=1